MNHSQYAIERLLKIQKLVNESIASDISIIIEDIIEARKATDHAIEEIYRLRRELQKQPKSFTNQGSEAMTMEQNIK